MDIIIYSSELHKLILLLSLFKAGENEAQRG